MRRVRDEDGAVAVMVGILLFVLFGFGALVIDVGNLYDERRQLQNGADAAALALAAECAESVVDCAAAASVLAGAAQPYADGNARDGASGVPPLMPHGADPETCEPGGAPAPNPLTDTRTVKVSTETVAAGTGDTFVTHWLAGLIGTQTTTVNACAVAGWGYLQSLQGGLPLIISMCEYDGATIVPGPHPNPTAATVGLLFHQGTGKDAACKAQAGHDLSGDDSLPAGFGSLNSTGCQTDTTTVEGSEWVIKDSGADAICTVPELEPLLNTVVQVPVFIDFCRPQHDPKCPNLGPGNPDVYRIETYASFYLQGFRLGGAASARGNTSACGNPSNRCIAGYFTTSTILDGDIDGPEGDVRVVRLID